MRLIDADALVEDIEEYQKSMMFDSYAERMHFDEMIDFAVDHLEEAPTIDAVPVVRCKDCIHAVDITNYRMAKRFGDHAKQCMRCRGDSGFGYLDLSVVYPDGFCDEGEMRND